jgi:hypothetical protein
VSISPYNTFEGNPILNVDPFGDSTFVRKNSDGTYKVTGGSLKGDDNGIYLQDEKGNIGELIDYSATPESFYNSEEKKWLGQINPNDESGRNFLNKEIIAGRPDILYYMLNATGGGKYDFKRLNAKDNKDPKYEDPENFYRGMPILDKKNGKPIFASARDIGNIGAGLVAGYTGINWELARLAFDGLEKSQKNDKNAIESSSTKYAQRLGWRMGYQLITLERAWRVKNRSTPELERIHYTRQAKNLKEVNKDIMTKAEYQP